MGLSKRRKALITLATLIGTFLVALDSTVVGTAMPTVIGELGGLKLALGITALAALFPRGRAKDFVNREEMP